jgi:mRNA-degrading endonuclease RelE of RelBE toxin-antitoxin system
LSIPKEELHRLIDALPEQKIAKAKRILEKLLSEKSQKNLRSLSEHLSDPIYDDETESDNELIAAKNGRQDAKAGRVHDIEEVAIITEQAKKDLSKLDKITNKRILRGLLKLKTNQQVDLRKLRGTEDE